MKRFPIAPKPTAMFRPHPLLRSHELYSIIRFKPRKRSLTEAIRRGWRRNLNGIEHTYRSFRLDWTTAMLSSTMNHPTRLFRHPVSI